MQNRLESTITSLQISEQNIQAAESRIPGADMAAEMMQFTRLASAADRYRHWRTPTQAPQSVAQLCSRILTIGKPKSLVSSARLFYLTLRSR